MIDLDGSRFRARCALLLEAVWPAIWPALGVVGLFLCAALLDLPRLLPGWAHAGLLAAVAGAILALLYQGFRGFRFPDEAAADRRLEGASGLSHRPLAVLSDQPALMDEAGMALWQAHVARTLRQIGRLKIGLPRPGLPRRDPRALRAALVVGLIACLAVAGADAPSLIAGALHPTLSPLTPAAAPELSAWITPPPYTRVPPIFLRTEPSALSVPAGSRLVVSVTGAAGTPRLSLDGTEAPFHPLDTGSFQTERELTASTHLSVLLGSAALGRWDLTVLADQPPVIAWDSPPGRAQNSQQTRLPWRVEDDYGLTALWAELRLEGRPDAPPLAIAIPLPGGANKAAKGVNQQDLTAYPWAGLPVVATLIGRDFPGHTSASAPASFVLPERPFLNPIAQALIQVRKGLSLHPDDRGDEMAALDALMQKPEAFGEDLGALLNLSGIYHKLVRDPSDAGIAEAQDRLWQLALHLEEGNTESTAAALEQARRAAKDALEALLNVPSQANRDALDARLRELQQAIDRHLQALLEEARRTGEPPPVPPDGQSLTQQDLQRQADRTRDAARDGKPEDAQRRMAELERMLDRLRDAKPGQANQRSAEERSRGRQQMGAVQDMVGREGGLLDHTDGRVDEIMRLRPFVPPSGADPDAARETDRRVQLALRRSLGELMQQFGDLTGEIPPSLGEADQAMREAGRQLAEGRDKAAGESAQQAIEALQKGAQEMGQAMTRKFGPPRPGSGDDEGGGDEALFGMTMPGQPSGQSSGTLNGDPGRSASRGRDPLGRTAGNGTSGEDENGDVAVPEERERQKTLAIQQELRRRGAERARPQPELDYIDRLLKQF